MAVRPGAIGALQRRLYGGEGAHAIRWAPDQVARLMQHYGVSRMPAGRPVIAAVPDVGIRKSGGYSGSLHQFTISTGSLDREGDTIDPRGWDIAGFLKNPVVLWAHDSRQLPIGTATNVWREGNALKAKMHFAGTAVAQQIEQLLDDRVLRATSVGFAPRTFSFSTSGINFFEQELLEFSIVPVPANPDALLEATTSAKDQRALDLMAVRVRVGSPTAEQRKRQRELDLMLLQHGKARPRDEALAAQRRHERELDVARLRTWR